MATPGDQEVADILATLWWALTPPQRGPHHIQAGCDVLKEMDAFRHMSDSKLDKIVRRVTSRRMSAGEVLYREGATGGPCFYVMEGGVQLFKHQGGGKKASNTSRPGSAGGDSRRPRSGEGGRSPERLRPPGGKAHRLKQPGTVYLGVLEDQVVSKMKDQEEHGDFMEVRLAGRFVSQVECMAESARRCSAVALADTTILIFQAKLYSELVASGEERKCAADAVFLQVTECFKWMSDETLIKTCLTMKKIRFSAKKDLITQGKTSRDLFIIRGGVCSVVRRVNLAPLVKDAAPLGPQEAINRSAHIVDLGPGDLVGHDEALSGKPALFAVTAKNDVEAWRVSIDQLSSALKSGSEKIIGKLKEHGVLATEFHKLRARQIGTVRYNDLGGSGGADLVVKDQQDKEQERIDGGEKKRKEERSVGAGLYKKGSQDAVGKPRVVEVDPLVAALEGAPKKNFSRVYCPPLAINAQTAVQTAKKEEAKKQAQLENRGGRYSNANRAQVDARPLWEKSQLESGSEMLDSITFCAKARGSASLPPARIQEAQSRLKAVLNGARKECGVTDGAALSPEGGLLQRVVSAVSFEPKEEEEESGVLTVPLAMERFMAHMVEVGLVELDEVLGLHATDEAIPRWKRQALASEGGGVRDGSETQLPPLRIKEHEARTLWIHTQRQYEKHVGVHVRQKLLVKQGTMTAGMGMTRKKSMSPDPGVRPSLVRRASLGSFTVSPVRRSSLSPAISPIAAARPLLEGKETATLSESPATPQVRRSLTIAAIIDAPVEASRLTVPGGRRKSSARSDRSVFPHMHTHRGMVAVLAAVCIKMDVPLPLFLVVPPSEAPAISNMGVGMNTAAKRAAVKLLKGIKHRHTAASGSSDDSETEADADPERTSSSGSRGRPPSMAGSHPGSRQPISGETLTMVEEKAAGKNARSQSTLPLHSTSLDFFPDPIRLDRPGTAGAPTPLPSVKVKGVAGGVFSPGKGRLTLGSNLGVKSVELGPGGNWQSPFVRREQAKKDAAKHENKAKFRRGGRRAGAGTTGAAAHVVPSSASPAPSAQPTPLSVPVTGSSRSRSGEKQGGQTNTAKTSRGGGSGPPGVKWSSKPDTGDSRMSGMQQQAAWGSER